MGDDGTGLAILARLKTKLAGGNPAGLDAADDENSWRPTAKRGPVDQVADPGTIAPEIINGVGFVNGGTSGLELLDTIRDAERLLVLDSVTGPGQPGDVVVLVGDQVPRLVKSKLSPHQVGLLDLLAAAQLTGHSPDTVAVVGIVAQSAELGVGLSPVVADALVPATEQAARLVADWTR
ncbi:hydrogenase maturation protease [Corynebacterium mendelii]|uniref:Hydrogenase maturation protease n=1 Tax=Corynebacterium mendelii TaxID=2765362 RepID=A0A939E1I4_9CORY|nr:hydrogenase maturation protease [Corynebacterium mendelii]MBN9643981.1 hydrogenase maturation protease [Corynebacterium mendelii]